MTTEMKYITVAIVFLLCYIIGSLFINEYYDPHKNDENYCRVWGQSQEFKLTVPYIPNIKVADRVCSCETIHHSNLTVDGVEYPPMYPYSIVCERKAGL